MKLLLLAMGVLALVFGTSVSLFVSGEVTAIVVAAAVIIAVIAALTIALSALRFIVVALALVAAAALAYGGLTAYSLYDALTTTDGPVDEPDPAALAAAQDRIIEAKLQGEFEVEMTDAELTALLLSAMQDSDDNPLRRVDLTFVPGKNGGPGHIAFDGDFKNGSSSVTGKVKAVVKDGQVEFEVDDVDIAGVNVPGMANGALADLADKITELNEHLAAQGARVESVDILDGVMVVRGTVPPPA